MKAFDERVDTKWSWVAKYPQVDPKHVRLVARVAGQLVGCADTLISRSGVAGFSYIYVDRAYRHRGIRPTLLREVASVCEQRGATSMFAPMSRREFYEVNGWRAQREFISMTKPLTA